MSTKVTKAAMAAGRSRYASRVSGKAVFEDLPIALRKVRSNPLINSGGW